MIKTIKSRRKPCKTIGELKVGESGWVPHWQFDVDKDGNVVGIPESFPVGKQAGTRDTKVTRTSATDFTVDFRESRQRC